MVAEYLKYDVGTADQSSLLSMLILVLTLGASEIFVYTFLKWMAWYQHHAHDYSEWIHDGDHDDEKAMTEFIESINCCELPNTVVDTSCPICLERLDDDDKVTLQCRHVFCKHCLMQWFKRTKTCPCCRAIAINDQDDTTAKERLPLQAQLLNPTTPWDASFSLFM